MLSSYPATLALTTWVSFQVHDFLLSTGSMVSFVSGDSFLSSLPIWVLFISFSCQAALARASTSTTNSTEKHGMLVLSLLALEGYSLVLPRSGCATWVFPSACHHAKEAASVSSWQSAFIMKRTGLQQGFVVCFKTIEVIVYLFSLVLLIRCIKLVFWCWPTFVFLA